jgi:hypothetical protein
VDEKG